MNTNKGFTLLELLVVLIVIGLFASMLMLSVTKNDKRTVEREAKRLFHLIQLAQDEAIIKGVELGLAIQKDRYSFSSLQENKWLLITEDLDFNEHIVAENINITVEVENEQVVSKVDENTVLPAIVILSTGELTHFKINMSSSEQPLHEFQVIGQESGAISLKSPTND